MSIDLNNSIKILNLESDVENILINNQILKVKDLWSLNRKALKNIDLTDNQIHSIIVKLQLNGIELNKKINNNDRLSRVKH